MGIKKSHSAANFHCCVWTSDPKAQSPALDRMQVLLSFLSNGMAEKDNDSRLRTALLSFTKTAEVDAVQNHFRNLRGAFARYSRRRG